MSVNIFEFLWPGLDEKSGSPESAATLKSTFIGICPKNFLL